jgi:Gas vesicle protein G
MGLISALLTLPLAPVRGTVWIAERLEEQALAELEDDSVIRDQLQELDAAAAAGEIDDEELAAAQDELVARLMEQRGFAGTQEGTDGDIR